MSSVSKESLMLLSNCDCSGVKAWANTVAIEAEREGLVPEEAEQKFLESLDPSCAGQISNPNSICEDQCSVPPLICGHEKGAHFLLRLAMASRSDLSV